MSPSNAAVCEEVRTQQDVSADHPDLAITKYAPNVATNPAGLQAQANPFQVGISLVPDIVDMRVDMRI